jgi:chromosome segregation ATPase
MGGSPPGPAGASEPHSPIAAARHSRFLGQQYADVTKLREVGAKFEHKAARIHQRIARVNTRIEKLRHQATILRERAAKAIADRPEVEQEVKQRARDLDRAKSGASPGLLRSDVTALEYRLRKTQQKVEDINARARSLELRAAQKTQHAAELKVKVDQLLEAARLAEEEASQYRQRADRLQFLTDQDAARGATAPAPGGPPPPPPPAP